MITKRTRFAELAQQLPPGRLLEDPVALLTYERDASIEHGLPDAVVFPRSAAEVAQIARWAAQTGTPLIARGAGTGLSGGAVPEHGGLIVQFSHLDRLRELDAAGRSALVEPGLINLTLDSAAKALGLYYPPDPASGRASTLGGNLAENAGGPHCFKYGVTSNYVTGLEVVLADGRLVQLGGRALDYPEYDLCALLVGSEGTLGLITAASVRLLRNPPALKTMMAAFDSVEAAGAAVSAVIAHGLVPATMEMMDRSMMRIIEDFVPAGLPTEAGAALIIEADGYPQSVGPQIEEIAEILRQNAGFNLRIAASAEERERIWYGRKSAAGAMARLAPAYYLVDGTVPRSKLAETLAGVNQICLEAELRVAYVFHAGDGNLHPFIPIERPNDKVLLERIIETGRAILELCVAHGGSITGEHGVGIEKRAFMPLMYSADELEVMQRIRAIFDPQQILNPGKIFPQPAPLASAPVAGPPPAPGIHTPATAQQAAQLLHALSRAGQPIRLRGAGTKSFGLPTCEQVVSSAGLSGIVRLERDDLYVVAGAGTPLAELQAELAALQLFTPLATPWPQATLGGIVASNFNAPSRMRYGAIRDILLATTVALPDGRVIRAGRPVVKNVAGYDLPKLYAGAYGTLGLLCDLTLKLFPLPRARQSLLIPLESLEQGLDYGAKLLPLCLVATGLLLVRRDEAAASLAGLAEQAPYALLYSAEGHPADVAAELAQVQALLASLGQTETYSSATLTGDQLWGEWLVQPANSATLRVGLGLTQLAGALRQLNPAAGLLADLANGQLYVRHSDPAALQRLARGLGGYAMILPIAGVPEQSERWGYTSEAGDLQQALRHEFGAHGLLNPGAFVV